MHRVACPMLRTVTTSSSADTDRAGRPYDRHDEARRREVAPPASIKGTVNTHRELRNGTRSVNVPSSCCSRRTLSRWRAAWSSGEGCSGGSEEMADSVQVAVGGVESLGSGDETFELPLQGAELADSAVDLGGSGPEQLQNMGARRLAVIT
jgi:hypothetical protein